MRGLHRIGGLNPFASLLMLAVALGGCSSSQPASRQVRVRAAASTVAVAAPAARPFSIPRVEAGPAVMLGIDVLESEGFAPLRGKRLGLLTHPAGVDSRGISTIQILHRAPGLRLVALYSMEHGLYDQYPASQHYSDQLDPHTGLMDYSLYTGRGYKPTFNQLRGIDALVVDLQDIGTRSYSFASAMKLAMEACFQDNIEVIVLDRPNPLGGLKVAGPMLDPQWSSQSGHENYLGEFPVPYVHGLTIGELARMAKMQPGVLRVSDEVRQRGRLTVIPMRGWHRNMRWPDTGLTWVPTSPMIPDFSAVVGYPMTGLGCEAPRLGGFSSGVGRMYPFRGVSNKYVATAVLERDLDALRLPGLAYRVVSAPNVRTGKPGTGLYVEVTDWDDWNPAELNFYLMKLDCKYAPRNPFASASPSVVRDLLLTMGSTAFYRDLVERGDRVNVGAYIRAWQERARQYQEQSRRYWLYD